VPPKRACRLRVVSIDFPDDDTLLVPTDDPSSDVAIAELSRLTARPGTRRGARHGPAGTVARERRATSRPEDQPGPRPRAGGLTPSVGRPAVAISHAITEFEFHISPAFNSSRPHTGVGTVATRSSSRPATMGSLVSRRGGCDLALDDFGTGFGSFSYLKHLPARYVKIDMEFVREIVSNSTDASIRTRLR
jgi:EAL domain